MNIVTMDNDSSLEYIHRLLRNSEWTDEQIENITEDQMAQVVEAINKTLMGYAEKREETNREKFEKCMKILMTTNLMSKAVSETEDVDFQTAIESLVHIEAAKWKAIHAEIGEEGFLWLVNGLVEDGAIDQEMEEEILNLVYS